MSKYEHLEKAVAEPEAASMIESFRAVGYSIETAMADIIDNSLSAGAKQVWIDRVWRGGGSFISIKDDGGGMDSGEIIQAMRPGAINPLSERRITDMGRFGLGLKTASFSQCRKLTVLSKREGSGPTCWTWDLDYVAMCSRWELLRWLPSGFENALDDLSHGTMVIWTDLDRVVPRNTSEEDEEAHRRFSASLDKAKRHLEMTFHRFIDDENIKFYWCGHEMESWDPFCSRESKTQIKSTDTLRGGVTVKGYILPHKNNFSSEAAFKRAEGIYGWPAQQGFYVYRNKRLLLAGDWLGLRRKEEHLKLVRIQVDLPNSVDGEWQIDIKKSKASPPGECLEQLRAYAALCCQEGEKVFRHRGKILRQRAGTAFQPIWLEKKMRGDSWSFVINRQHELIRQTKLMAKEQPEKSVEILLKFIEESIPTKSIFIKEAKGEENERTPFGDLDVGIVKEMLRRMYDNLTAGGRSPEQAKAFLKTQEPFNNYEDLIEEL